MKRITILTAILALGLAVAVAAQPGPRGGHMDCDGHGMGMKGHRAGHGARGGEISRLLNHADDLELTDQQQEQLKDMALEFQTEAVDRRADIKKAEIAARALRMDENASQADVFNSIDEIAKLKAELAKARYAHREAVKNVLTAEQQEKIKDLMKARGRAGECDGDGPHGPRGKKGRSGMGR